MELKRMTRLHTTVTDQIVADFYDRPIMSNLVRPHYVERMIALGLGKDWKLVSAEWSGWDLENHNGVRIEVKQSAARQTWTGRLSLEGRATRGSFDIGPRTGYWTDNGAKWVEAPGRAADIYIFAWHPVVNEARADHRDQAQWKFYVVREQDLPPNQKTISLPKIACTWLPVAFEELQHFVSQTVVALGRIKVGLPG